MLSQLYTIKYMGYKMKVAIRSAMLMLLTTGILFISACSLSSNSSTCLTGEDMPADVKTQVDKLNAQVVQAIKANDTKAILAIAGTTISSQSDALQSFIQSEQSLMVETPKLMDEYYITFAQTGNTTQTITPALENTPYYFYLEPISTKMVVLFSTFNKSPITYILGQTYALEGNDWKLAGLNITDYAYNGMNAPALYDKALNYQKNNDIAPATLYANLLTGIMQPANMISYPNANDMVKFQSDISTLATKTFIFPLSVQADNKTYSIVDVLPMLTDQGIACTVKYVTDTPLANTSQIETEANSIQKVLDNYFSGLSDSMDAFLMQAYNETPSDSNKTYDCYSSVIIR